MKKKFNWLAAFFAVMILVLAGSCETNVDNLNPDGKKIYAAPVTFTATEEEDESISVAMASATPGATIYYTTDGTEPTVQSTLYSESVSFTEDTTVKAIAVKKGVETSPVSVAFVSVTTKTITEYVDKDYVGPISFGMEENESGIHLTIQCTETGASIYYTTDGTEPTTSSTLYTEPIVITEDMTVKAVAVKDGKENSPVSAAFVSVTIKTITEYVYKDYVGSISFGMEENESGIHLTIQCTETDASIYYTTDGTEPTTSSTLYTVPVVITEDMTVKAVAVKDGKENSPVSAAFVSVTTKTITEYVEKDYVGSISFGMEENESGIHLTIQCTETGASIYYTTDGTEPTTSSTLYTAPVVITEDMTVKAVAVKDGKENSQIAAISISVIKIDTTAPKDVTNLDAVNKDAAVLLSWIDPEDTDLFGIEITYTPATSSRAVAPLEPGSLFVAPGDKRAYIGDLTNGTEYTFTVKSVDTSGNKSTGVSKTITPSIIEKSPLSIMLTPDTEKKTNQNVTVSVKAVTDDDSAVKKIAWVKGTVASVSDVLKGTDITDSMEFFAEENGEFTVAASDTAGRRELAWITVDNIDKTAPKDIQNLALNYDSSTDKLTVTWKDPADSDLSYVLLTYKVGDAEKVETQVSKGTQKFAIPDTIAANVTVSVSAVPYDDVGNAGTAVTKEEKTVESYVIKTLTLSKDHVEYSSNKTITVTITGDNFNLLPTDSENALTVKVYDGTTVLPACTTIAAVDTENNTATASFTAPDGTNSTTGKTYTVDAMVDFKRQNLNASLRVSSSPSIYGVRLYDSDGNTVSQIAATDVTDTTTVTAKIMAYNLDIADEVKLAFFDSDGNIVEGASKIVTEEDYKFSNTTSYEEFSVAVPVPQSEGIYTLKVLWDNNKINYTYNKTLQIYGDPRFTEFVIPSVSAGFMDSFVKATIRGINFKAPGVTSENFKFTCTNGPTITVDSVATIVSDAEATVLLTFPVSVTETTAYDVTATYGAETITAKFNIVKPSEIAVVEVKGGTVTGSGSDGVFINERTVTLSSFYIGKYEVTQKEYEEVMTGQIITLNGTTYSLNASPSWFSSNSADGEVQEKRPVEYVTWYDAVYYCNARSKADGLTPAYNITVKSASKNTNGTYSINSADVSLVEGANGWRLPTEAEWEYVARGGNPNDETNWNYKYSGSNAIDDVAWYNSNSDKKTHEVGKKTANLLGICDMTGNVWEWCWDWYGDVSTGTVTDPTGASFSSSRVRRGGSLYYDANYASVCRRSYYAPFNRDYDIGFRVVRSSSN